MIGITLGGYTLAGWEQRLADATEGNRYWISLAAQRALEIERLHAKAGNAKNNAEFTLKCKGQCLGEARKSIDILQARIRVLESDKAYLSRRNTWLSNRVSATLKANTDLGDRVAGAEAEVTLLRKRETYLGEVVLKTRKTPQAPVCCGIDLKAVEVRLLVELTCKG